MAERAHGRETMAIGVVVLLLLVPHECSAQAVCVSKAQSLACKCAFELDASRDMHYTTWLFHDKSQAPPLGPHLRELTYRGALMSSASYAIACMQM